MSELPKLPETDLEEKKYKNLTRRSLLVAGIAGLSGYGIFNWIHSMELDRGIPWLLRRGFGATDTLFKASFRKTALAPDPGPPAKPIRVNGDVGILEGVDPVKWRMKVAWPDQPEALSLSLAEIRALPAADSNFLFKCIEGWSQNVSCRGARFSEFMAHYKLGRVSPSGEITPYKYALLKCVNEEYFVSMDIESLMHPQTILCYEMSGEPLGADHGAPLRLMTAVKYGVKSIKQIGSIEFSDVPPVDYWAEAGYGDFIGL